MLPKGVPRSRNFGFLHPNSKRLIAPLQIVQRQIRAPEQWRGLTATGSVTL